MNAYASWFRWITILGILVNSFFALPGVFIPNPVIELAGGEPVAHTVWPVCGFVLWLVVLVLSIPAFIDPVRHRTVAWVAVLGRFAGAAFWFAIYPGHNVLLASVDLAFGIVQGILLAGALRARSVAESA